MSAFSTPEKRKSKINSFGNGYQRLSEMLHTIPEDVMSYRAHRDVWNINEMVIHLADLEAAAYVNFRRAVAEPTEDIIAFDKDLWAESLTYYNQPIDASLKLFRLLRTSNYLLLKNISHDGWLNTVNYPENGQITLEDLLDLYENHFETVIKEIQRNVDDRMKEEKR
ncbi:MAG: DinB family protein [Chitinophagaceae bacterium]|nr:DinB family protein [Chitinophagaceae bacterium]